MGDGWPHCSWGPVGVDIYNGQDPRFVPIYSIGDVSRHLHIPPSTVRAWVRSREGPTPFRRVIVPDDRIGSQLSFRNLVEVHVLSSLRAYKIPLPRIREAIAFLRRLFKGNHPLAEIDLRTDGTDIFVEYFGTVLEATGAGQVALRPVVERYLERVERGADGILRRLYPFIDEEDTSRAVAIDPRRRFGRPYLVEVGVETSAIVSRYRAGDTVAALARDFDTTEGHIGEALRFEKAFQEAA